MAGVLSGSQLEDMIPRLPPPAQVQQGARQRDSSSGQIGACPYLPPGVKRRLSPFAPPGTQASFFCRASCACPHLPDVRWCLSPILPLLVRCRCVPLPVTKTWRELGLDIDEMEEVVRPYTQRGNVNIDAGGRRTIEEVGFHNGDYGTRFAGQDRAWRERTAGSGRVALLDDGEIEFHDLVDRDTGRLRTLKELRGEEDVHYVRAMGGGGDGGGTSGGKIKGVFTSEDQATEWIKDNILTAVGSLKDVDLDYAYDILASIQRGMRQQRRQSAQCF